MRTIFFCPDHAVDVYLHLQFELSPILSVNMLLGFALEVRESPQITHAGSQWNECSQPLVALYLADRVPPSRPEVWSHHFLVASFVSDSASSVSGLSLLKDATIFCGVVLPGS